MNVKLQIKDQYQKMEPMIFGHFVEFMRDCIDEGMWAQLLKNRGFDKAKEIPDKVVDGNPNVAEGWYRTGYKNSFEIQLDAEASLARDGYAQKINCYNDYNGFVGIAQGDLHLEPTLYEGYVWIKAKETATVSIHVTDAGQQVILEEEIQVNDGWNRYEFRFEPKAKTLNGIFELRLHGVGVVWFDGASIMPADHIGGIWKDVFRHIEDLNPPIIRYPGGCFADCYHFEDGIGPIDSRPYRHNRHWGGYTDNSFGTDEYMEFCRNIGCEPMICVNFGSGTPEEAANWVEYCNGSADTPFGRMRAEHGHPEPYQIKYWDIGNEIFGDWEIGHSNAEDYARKYLKFYEAMREKDDSIVFMVCGGEGDEKSQDWNQKVTEIVGSKMDALCLHMYALKDMEGQSHPNQDVYYAVVGAVKKYEEILNESYQTVNRGSEKAIMLAVTEYNLGTIIDSYREQTLEAAIFNAGMLNMYLRNSDKLVMCNYSDLVNGWPGGCIVSRDGKAFGTASYYVLQMYSESGIGQIVKTETDSPVYRTEEKIGNVEPLKDVPLVDVVVGIDEQGRKVAFAVNRSLQETVRLSVNAVGEVAEITEICAEQTSDMNHFDDMVITPLVRTENNEDGLVLLKPHSINRIRFQ